MKVYIGEQLYEVDPNKQPLFIVFEDDKERKIIGNHILNMEPNDDGIRIYSQFPSAMLATKMKLLFDRLVQYHRNRKQKGEAG